MRGVAQVRVEAVYGGVKILKKDFDSERGKCDDLSRSRNSIMAVTENTAPKDGKPTSHGVFLDRQPVRGFFFLPVEQQRGGGRRVR